MSACRAQCARNYTNTEMRAVPGIVFTNRAFTTGRPLTWPSEQRDTDATIGSK